jgi:Putative peptidoglycan binding domain/Sel1 repeat
VNLSLPWIIASIFSLTLAGGASYLYWVERTKPPPFEPIWCSPQFDDETDDGDYTSPTGVKSNGGPASTSGTTPTDAATAAAGAMAQVLGGDRRAPKKTDISSNRVGRAADLSRAEGDGSEHAGGIRRGLALTPEENYEADIRFVYDSQHDGVMGFYRLALVTLGVDAFKIARASRREKQKHGLYVPFCSTAKFGNSINVPNVPIAYTYFAFVKHCNEVVGNPPWQAWMDEIKRHRPGPDYSILEEEATKEGGYFDQMMERHKFDPNDPQQKYNFCIGVYEAPPDKADCRQATTSRQALKLGEASYADGDKDEARACWRTAIELGKTDPDGAEPANQAQWRLQTMTTTCKWTPESLAAITRDYEARSTDLITVKTQQHALTALGHYDGPINGQLGPQTRAAIRKYQRERSEDETDILTPLQITHLICNAAETTRDLVSENTLGVMYTVGLGVEQNIDKAQQWLTDAANRRHADSQYNLALLYGTRIILDSYRLCDVPRAPEQAEKYMQEAAAGPPGSQGQHRAMILMSQFGPGSKYGALSAPDRWMLIERQAIDKIRSGPFASKFQHIGKKCDSNGISP